MRERMCIITRESKPEDQLLRFVSDMQQCIIPDLKANLPGRGAWVTLDQVLIQSAFEKNVLHRSLEIKGQSEQSLSLFMAMVMERFDHSVLGSFGLARRAGTLITGFEKVMKELSKENVLMLIHAKDAARDGVAKIAGRAKSVSDHKKLYVENSFSNETLSKMLGHPNVMHAAILRKTSSNKAIMRGIYRRNKFYGVKSNEDGNIPLTLDVEHRNRRYKD